MNEEENAAPPDATATEAPVDPAPPAAPDAAPPVEAPAKPKQRELAE